MSQAREKKRQVQKFLGKVEIVIDRCKGCGFCVEFCPTAALELSSHFNVKGYHPPRVVDPDFCSGCGLCGLYCPDFAIYGHRVGPNPHFKKEGATTQGTNPEVESKETKR
ncbi:MAG: ferredoxin family protein [Candidatus Riflebacteria bacterium]|nr:ferredoxin family protein [Candidatus Riflebacteria bacterium]